MKYTWAKSPGKPFGIFKKLDRILGNYEFMTEFPNASATFLPFVVSDHTPCVLALPSLKSKPAKPFKFPNFIACKPAFLPIVSEIWSRPVIGFNMYSVTQRLKALKKPLRCLLHKQGNIFENVTVLKKELECIQAEIDSDPHTQELKDEEMAFRLAYQDAIKDEECFLKQKAKVTWLTEGDQTSKYFHKVVNGNAIRQRISSIHDVDGNVFVGKQIGEQFVQHFKKMMGTRRQVQSIREP